ncbi:MAG: sporulation protein YunB [Clostridia bacterium]|nr:sporulation protein YunB [Clostridia bacterium]
MQRTVRFSSEKRKRTVLRRLLTVICVFLALCLIVHIQVLPGLYLLGKRSLQDALERLLTETVDSVLSEERFSYDTFVSLSFKEDGTVACAKIDAAAMNRLRYDVTRNVLKKISATESLSVSVPLYAVTGLFFLSGVHTTVTFRLHYGEQFQSKYLSELTEAGMNQTLHSVFLSFRINVTVIYPGKWEETSLSEKVCLAQTLIAGKVPDTLTQINRLSQEITEEEIDDAVDFGVWQAD